MKNETNKQTKEIIKVRLLNSVGALDLKPGEAIKSKYERTGHGVLCDPK